MDNYLAAEQILAERLQNVDGLRTVYTTTTLAELPERSQVTPCAHVIYGGDRIPDNAQGGAVSHVNQTWLIVLAVRLGRDSQQAGILLEQIIRALMGHRAGGLGPFKRVNSPARPSFTQGFGYYPVAFQVTFRQSR